MSPKNRNNDIDREDYDLDILDTIDYQTDEGEQSDELADDNTVTDIPVSRPKPQPQQQQGQQTARQPRQQPQPAPRQPQQRRPRPEPAEQERPRKPEPSARPKGTDARVREPRRSIAQTLTDSRVGIFIGVLLLLAAGYMLLVSVSYYFHGEADQSIVTNATGIDRAVTTSPAEVKNTGGVFGAWLADLLMSQWLGIGSFVLIFYLAAVGLSLVRVRRFKFWNLTSRCLITAIALSVILGFFTVMTADSEPSYTYIGGLHGHELNRRLVELTGVWGALFVSLLLLALVILIYLSDIKDAWHAWQRHMEHRHELAAIRREEREKEEARRKAERDAIRAKREAEHEAERQAAAARDKEIATARKAVEQPAVSDEFEVSEAEAEAKGKEEEKPAPKATGDNEEKQSDDSVSAPDVPTEPSFTVEVAKVEQASVIENTDAYDPTADLSRFKFPPIDLLIEREVKTNSVDSSEQEENKERITKTLSDYGIAISSIKATVGPTVTLYEIVPAEGVRIAKIKHLEDDIALSLSALGIRIIAPIPGRGTIGIEVPNKDPQTVSIRSIIGSKKFQECRMELPMALGCTISNDVFIADLTKMPHLLVAGATGMGKSVGLNTIIASLLYKKHPAELKFVLIDPKMVEFSLYAKLEHHYMAKLPDEDEPIITNVNKAVATLKSLCVEMDNRYALLKEAGQRNIKEYNAKFISRALNPEKGHRYLPYIVVIVDEFADLIMQVGKEVETPIARIAQKARAVGIHMILATQRPSTNVITGVIKANFPGRIAFRVFQMVDSRTILDRPGANQLIGRGDMLFSTGGHVERVQCAFIDTPEVDAICDSISEQMGYPNAYELPEYTGDENEDAGPMTSLGDRDPLFDEAARLVVNSGQASASSLQRRYSIGYNRAGKIMDQMEAAGIVGPSQGGKARQVLMDPVQLERLLGGDTGMTE